MPGAVESVRCGANLTVITLACLSLHFQKIGPSSKRCSHMSVDRNLAVSLQTLHETLRGSGKSAGYVVARLWGRAVYLDAGGSRPSVRESH